MPLHSSDEIAPTSLLDNISSGSDSRDFLNVVGNFIIVLAVLDIDTADVVTESFWSANILSSFAHTRGGASPAAVVTITTALIGTSTATAVVLVVVDVAAVLTAVEFGVKIAIRFGIELGTVADEIHVAIEVALIAVSVGDTVGDKLGIGIGFNDGVWMEEVAMKLGVKAGFGVGMEKVAKLLITGSIKSACVRVKWCNGVSY